MNHESQVGICIDLLLEKLTSSHDIERNYPADGRVWDAYACYAAASEKYVLTKKAALWSAQEFEHMLITHTDTVRPETIVSFQNTISRYMEPEMVHPGKALPDANHMRSFLTIAAFCSLPVSGEVIRMVKKYRFDKGYRFSLRGFAQGRIVLIDLASHKVYTSASARDVQDFFTQIIEKH